MERKRKMLEKTEAPVVHETQPWQKSEVLEWLATLAKSPQLSAENSDRK
jgi:hypothetical protein